MSATVVTEGLQVIQSFISKSLPMDLRLFTNDRAPKPTDTAENYKYLKNKPIVLTRGWTIDGDIVFEEVEVSIEGTATVYGYTVQSGTNLLWAERFPEPIQANQEDRVFVTPRFGLE